MQNAIQKFRQSSIAFEKPDILSQKFKTLTSSIQSMNAFLMSSRVVVIFILSKQSAELEKILVDSSTVIYVFGSVYKMHC